MRLQLHDIAIRHRWRGGREAGAVSGEASSHRWRSNCDIECLYRVGLRDGRDVDFGIRGRGVVVTSWDRTLRDSRRARFRLGLLKSEFIEPFRRRVHRQGVMPPYSLRSLIDSRAALQTLVVSRAASE